MAAFPAALIPSPRSGIRPDSGLKTYVTEGGGVRGRSQYTETLYYLQLVYELLTDAEYDLVLGLPGSHYDTAPTGEHTVAVRGETYDVTYQNEPRVIEYRGDLRTLQVSFVGTKQ